MRLLRRATLWQWAAIAATVCAFGYVTATRQSIGANEQEGRAVDLTDRFTADIPRTLQGVAQGDYHIVATFTNAGDETLEGPVRMVVNSTGIPQLVVKDPEGTLEAGEPWFTILPAHAALKKGEATKPLRIQFETAGRGRVNVRKRFELVYHLERPAADRAPAADSPRTGGRGIPTPPGSSEGNSSSAPREQGRKPPQSQTERNPLQPEADPVGERAPNKKATDEDIARVMAIQDRWTATLIKTEGVYGTATGLDSKGRAVVCVYTERAGISLPKTVEGVPVQMRIIAKPQMFQTIPPQDKRGQAGNASNTSRPITCTDDPTVPQDFPLPIGISVAHVSVTAGTIGCRVSDTEGNQYVLSNNHVLADLNAAQIGDNIQSPGPLDAGGVIPERFIGTLATFVPVDPLGANFVDCALAAVAEGTVGTTTQCYGYGQPRTTTVPAVIGMKVQKCGRTTELTTATITALNFSALIGDGQGGFYQFDDQIVLTTDFLPASMGGDSGSLVVTNTGRNPVGLLFAGGGLTTYINPIDEVLEQLGDNLGTTLKIDGDDR